MIDCEFIIVACQPDKGMKSHGSKGMLSFNNKRLFDHQINWIKNISDNINIIADFDFNKVSKLKSKVNVIDAEGYNPILKCCQKFNNKHLCFIDYGCVFSYNILNKLTFKNTEIICIQDATPKNNLDIGCTITNDYIEYMFFDLPKNKFCNIVMIHKKDCEYINTNIDNMNNNLLSFEIINRIIQNGSVVKPVFIRNNFLYFNNMRQKNAINRFIKKNN